MLEPPTLKHPRGEKGEQGDCTENDCQPGPRLAQILAKADPPRDQRYADWIEQYASEEFAGAVTWLRAEMDRLGEGISEEKKNQVREIFLISSRYEWMFWQMCWEGESWQPEV